MGVVGAAADAVDRLCQRNVFGQLDPSSNIESNGGELDAFPNISIETAGDGGKNRATKFVLSQRRRPFW